MSSPVLSSELSAALPASPSSLPDTIYAALREAVLAGVYRPGEALRQEALARQFDASRVPVREALKRLEAEGLVMLRPRRGFVVTTLDIDEIEEVFQLRMMLEEHAAFLATLVRTANDIAEVEHLLHALDDTPVDTSEGIAQWSSLNRQFHSRLIISSRRKHVSNITNMLRDRVETYVRVEVSMTGDLDNAQAEHHAIFKAFKDGNAAAAGRLCREHCRHTSQRLVEGLRRGTEGDGPSPGS